MPLKLKCVWHRNRKQRHIWKEVKDDEKKDKYLGHAKHNKNNYKKKLV